MKNQILIVLLGFVFFSCSKEDDNKEINYSLKGTFVVETSMSNDPSVLLFENNRVFFAYEANSIHETLASGGNLKNESGTFTLNETTNEIKFILFDKEWSGVYDSETGEILNGSIKYAQSQASYGYFAAKKQFQKNFGSELLKGHWKGFYGFENETPNYNYDFIIENGFVTVVALNSSILNADINSSYGLSISEPTIHNNTITFTYTYINGGTFSVQATYNDSTKKLEGTWGDGTNFSNGGKIILESQNID